MKTTVLFYMCVLLSFSASLFAQDKQIPKELLGEWSYQFSHPMTGERIDGTCSIKEVKKEVKAYFTGGANTMETSNLRANDNGKFYGDMTAEGYPITVSFDLQGDQIARVFDAGVMQIPVSMNRSSK
ncbi:MAG: hypothetical protein LUG96_15170 [Tannerellaceae bacterium]|nr:hypothetical protein [Tannerellaceae bacterium]MCD7916458.1 hypothetical protein [Tannerellaceae bacterium]